MLDPVLGLVARPTPTARSTDALRDRLAVEARSGSVPWSERIARADAHGIAPLLARHLERAEIEVPRSAMLELRGLVMRYRRANQARADLLRRVGEGFLREGLGAVLVKGAALAFTLYPEPGLRAMRDVDMLVPTSRMRDVAHVLARAGFAIPDVAGWVADPDHMHHQRPVSIDVDGFTLTFEIHRKLGVVARGEKVTYEDVVSDSRPVPPLGDAFRTLGAEAALHYVHYHGFKTPLRWPDELRLVSVADLFAIVESVGTNLDWAALRRKRPHLVESLAWLDALSPWSDRERELLDVAKVTGTLGPDAMADYVGYPRRKWKDRTTALEFARATAFPPAWWMFARHGGRGLRRRDRARHFFRHVVEVLR
ncbi:MAG: nucleotidyltransferase family protein [Polyangiaceae bacterium]